MDKFNFTAKQVELFSDWKHHRLKRINILEGSVRSGKTFSSLILWALWIATRPADGKYLMVGKTLTTLKRNCLEPLQAMLGTSNMFFSIVRCAIRREDPRRYPAWRVHGRDHPFPGAVFRDAAFAIVNGRCKAFRHDQPGQPAPLA